MKIRTATWDHGQEIGTLFIFGEGETQRQRAITFPFYEDDADPLYVATQLRKMATWLLERNAEDQVAKSFSDEAA